MQKHYLKMNFIKLFLIFMNFISLAHCTCVFDSDFGFILNCNFKKSGLFRVRNLGGLKAHFGLGFSVGDDLGFAESLGNLEGGRRRALNVRTNIPNNIGVITVPNVSMKYPESSSINRKEIFNGENMKNVAPKTSTLLMTEAESLPLGVPAFRPIPLKQLQSKPSLNSHPSETALNNQVVSRSGSQKVFYRMNTTPIKLSNEKQNSNSTIPPFQLLPPQSNSRTSPKHNLNIDPKRYPVQDIHFVNGQNTLERLDEANNISFATINQNAFLQYQNQDFEKPLETKIMENHNSALTSTISSPEIIEPIRGTHQKVMNAPKEYYPIGYDKNFDDNFTTKVDLPPTSFNCGSQKHFPGLYADINLGCMVFHVCAVTDSGIIMKSFLCPESTLFDQTILKCNWWFYVDCKNSKSIYDSNIPVSKSYQLMKSLTYFSNYNKQSGDNKTDQLDLEALKNTVAEERKELIL